MKRLIDFIVAVVLTLVLFTVVQGCTDAQVSKVRGFGDSYTVSLVNCDGTITHSWISSGKVISEGGSDGYYFEEKGTGKLIEVSGTVIISGN